MNDDHTGNLQHGPAPPDPATAELQLRTAIDQLTQPEHVTLDRQPDTEQEAKTRHNTQRRDLAAYHTARAAGNLTEAAKIAARIIAAARTRIELPALLDQLQDAVTSSTNTGQPGTSATPAPIGLAAATLLAQIEHAVTRRTRRTHPTLTQQVNAWGSQAGAWRSTNPNQLHHAAQLAAAWVTEARQLLNPQRRYRPVRDTACPACQHTHAHITVNGDPDPQRQPALLVDTHTGWTICRACGEAWSPAYSQWLARVLAEQRADRAATLAEQRHAERRPTLDNTTTRGAT